MRSFQLFILLSLYSSVLSQTTPTDTLPYDEMYAFKDGFSLVKRTHLCGLVNLQLKEIIPPKLETIHCYDLSPYLFDYHLLADERGKTVVYDTSGNIIRQYDKRIQPLDTYEPAALTDQSYWVDSFLVRTANEFYSVFGNKNWGCIAPNGDTVIPFEAVRILKGPNATLIAQVPFGNNVHSKIYSRTGELRWKWPGRVVGWPSNHMYWLETANGIAAIDTALVTRDSTGYTQVIPCRDYSWVERNGIWRRIGTDFQPMDSTSYGWVHVNKYWGCVKHHGKHAFFNRDGDLITDFEYDGDWPDYYSDDRYILARKGEDKLFIIDTTGRVVRNIVLKSPKSSVFEFIVGNHWLNDFDTVAIDNPDGWINSLQYWGLHESFSSYELKAKNSHANESSYGNNVFSRIRIGQYRFGSNDELQTAVDSLLNCFPADCTSLQRDKNMAVKITPSIWILGDNTITIARTKCEHEDWTWNSLKRSMLEAFADENSEIIVTDCGKLMWRTKEEILLDE